MNIKINELQKISVLYVEDDEVIRTQTQALFEKMFKKVFVAKDGQESVNLFKNNQDEIDVIVSDINMPNLTGLEMTEQIHKIQKQFPIILTTAFSDTEVLEKAIELNISKYITKPLKIKELTSSVIEIVNRHQSEQNFKKITKVLSQKTINQQKENEELKTSNEKSERELEFYKSLVHSLVSHFKIDKNGTILEVSAKFCQLYEYHEEDILDENVNLITPQSGEVQKRMLEAIKAKKPITFTQDFMSKEKKILKFTTTIFPQYEADEGYVTSYILYQDLNI